VVVTVNYRLLNHSRQKNRREQIRSWGVNVVRYVTVWEAIEPEPDVINKEYIKKMKEKVRWLTRRSIYVIVDMHQDLYARKFCGDGAPEWAVFELLLTTRYEKSFTRFWKDGELQGHFLNALKAVVRELKHDVIGFEIFNEPWHGEFDIGFFESKVLTEFYRKAVKIIRKESKDCLIFFEPAVAASPVYGVASQIDKTGKDSVFP